MSEGMYQFDPELGYMPAIPEPFWEKRWYWLRYRPKCCECGASFKTRSEYTLHYALQHINPIVEEHEWRNL